MADTVPGEGTLLQIKIASVFTTIGNRVSIGGPASEVNAVDKTNLDSTLREYRPSQIPEAGRLSLSVFYDPNDSTHQILPSRVKTPGTIDDFKLIFNDGMGTPANETFSGFVTKFEKNGMEVDGNLGADVEIQLTTLVTSTEGSA
jgi:hypothetical protein